MDQEYKKARDRAQRPWPTKAALSKQNPVFEDGQGRTYYATPKDDEWVANHMESYDKKTHISLWCRLPPKTTSGGMPEEHTKTIFVQRSDKSQINIEFVHVSTLKYSRERGTGFVIVKRLS